MMLVYNLPATDAIYQRFGGVDGSAYFVGGFGMTALTANNIVLVPIRSGVGLRLGANVGYLKFTPERDLEPVLTATFPSVCQRVPPRGFRLTRRWCWPLSRPAVAWWLNGFVSVWRPRP